MASALFRIRFLAHQVKQGLRRWRGRLPLRFYTRHILKIDENRDAIPGLHDYHVIPHDQEFVSRTRQAIGQSDNMPTREMFVCELTKPRLHVYTGAVWVNDQKLIEDSVRHEYGLRLAFGTNNFSPKTSIFVPGTCATIMAPHITNYFHWFVDTLTRLYSLESLHPGEPITLLMRENLSPFQVSSLNWCLPVNVTVRYVPVRSWVVAENLLLPSIMRVRLNNGYAYEPLQYIRNSIFHGVGLTSDSRSSRRLYISRALASDRRVLNESEVLTCLSDYGFEILQSENLLLEEQVRLFHEAEWVVGPHGAGFTNILFSDNLKILEFANEPAKLGYQLLSSVCGHEHHYLPTNQPGKDTNMHIDVRLLESKLVEIGLQK